MAGPAAPAIRPAARADAEAIVAVHTAAIARVCSPHYTARQVRVWLSLRDAAGYHPDIDRGELFVCEESGRLIGFGQARPGQVVAVFVHPDRAGRGVGARLLEHALVLARRGHEGPVTVIATLNAVGFYERHGFRVVRRYAETRRGVGLPVVEMSLAPPPRD